MESGRRIPQVVEKDITVESQGKFPKEFEAKDSLTKTRKEVHEILRSNTMVRIYERLGRMSGKKSQETL